MLDYVFIVLLVADRMQSPKHEGYVDYVAFSDYVESAFTMKDLERNPAITPVPV